MFPLRFEDATIPEKKPDVRKMDDGERYLLTRNQDENLAPGTGYMPTEDGFGLVWVGPKMAWVTDEVGRRIISEVKE